MNYFDYINTLSPNERKKRIEILQKIGVAPATNDGFFTELGQGFAKGAISAVRGMAKTAEEFGISPAEKITEWADETLANNRQWDEHQDYSPLSLNLGNIGRTLGQGVASTVSVIPSAVAGTLIGGPVGTAVGAVGAGATIFAQSYGDNVDEYRKKFKGKYNDDEIRAIAGAQTLVDTGIETLLGSVPMLGKISKNIIGTATKNAFKETVKKYGKSSATRIFTEMGKGALGEGAEEVLQYFNEKAFHYLAGDKNLDVSAKEALERFAGGAWAGGLFGGVAGVTSKSDVQEYNPNAKETEKHFAKVDNPSNVESLERVAEGLKVHEDIEEVIPRTKSAKMLQQLGKELGMTVNFFTPLKNQDTFFNGAYDTESDIVWINAEKSARDPRFTLGHEFYHFLERSNPELAKTFKGLVDSNLQESEALNLEKELIGQAYQGEDIAPELTADRLGELFIDGEFWQKLSKAEPSFTKTLLDYINYFIEKVKLVFGKNPNAVNFINNLEEFKQKSIDEVLVPHISNLQTPQTEQVVQSESMFNTPSLDKSLLNTPSLEKPSLDSSSLDKSSISSFKDSSLETTDLGAKNIVNSIVGKPNSNSMLNKSSLDKSSLNKSSFDTPAQVEIPKEQAEVKAETPAEVEKVETPKAELKEEVTEPKAETEEKADAEEKAETEPKVNLAKEPMKKVLAKLYTKGAKGKIIDRELNFPETLNLLKFHGFDYTVKGAKIRKERRFVNPFNKKSVSYQKVQDIVKLFDDHGYVLLNVKEDSAPEVKDSGLSQKSANRVKYSKVRDKKLLQELENTKTIKLYRAVQIIDGKIYPPMAAKVNGKLIEPIELGIWEQSDVFYDGTKLKKNSKGIVQTDENGIPYFIFKLNKGNGSTIEADFAPYFHSSDSPLNDQFTSAWNRPNLRIMEVEVPISEATSGYRAKHSPKTTGWHKWNTTSVSKQLGGPRDVFLSRYDKPIRLLSNKEVADSIAEIVGKDVVIPENTVWDELRDLLIERGVKIGAPTDGQKRSKPVFDKDGNKIKYSRYRQVNPMISYLSPDQYKFHKDYLDNYKAPHKSNAQLKKDSAKKIADLGGIDKALKVALDGDLSTISDTNIYVYKTLLSCDEWKKLSKDEQTKLADQYHNALGSEAGRALAARRLGNFQWQDLESVISHINAFLAKSKNSEEIIKRVKEETGVDLNEVLFVPSQPTSTSTEETTSADDGKGETKPTETEKTTEKVKPTEKGNTNPLQNPDDLNKVLTSMLSATKRMNDKSYEFWINAIQSGITSPIVNVIGNATNIAYDLVAKRFVEATLNKAIFHRKDLATFAEFKQMSKAINWTQAMERAKFAWQHEALVKNSKLDRINVAIAGTKGKIIRTPTRILTIADEFAKSIIESVEATSEAFRHGNELGLNGKTLENYIAEQLKDEDSPANIHGRERALELTFQSEVGTVLNHLMEIKNSDTAAGLITRFFLPFVKGPANIIKKGARVTPLGAFNVAKDMFQIAVGKKDFDSKSLGLFAEQIIAWGSIMGLMSLMGDDDEYPLITGSQGALSATGRTFMRDKIPPYSIRIGGTYYSYKRLDPFATSLALIADGIANFQALKNGVKGEEVIKNLVGSVRSQFVDKSFFNAFNQLYQTLSTEGYAIKWGANFASSWMPNVVRQTAGYFDDNIRSSSNTAKGREWYENFFYMLVDKAGLLHGAPKIDYLGREIKKDSVEASAPLGIMARILALNPQSPDDNMGQVDRLLFNYAKKNPETAFYPDVPSYFFRHKGKMIYFTGENYNQYAKESGQIANRQIQNAIRHGLLNVNNPTNEDIKIIRGIFQRARAEVKARLIKENKFSF